MKYLLPLFLVTDLYFYGIAFHVWFITVSQQVIDHMQRLHWTIFYHCQSESSIFRDGGML